MHNIVTALAVRHEPPLVEYGLHKGVSVVQARAWGMGAHLRYDEAQTIAEPAQQYGVQSATEQIQHR